jgi:hypothetical protein
MVSSSLLAPALAASIGAADITTSPPVAPRMDASGNPGGTKL